MDEGDGFELFWRSYPRKKSKGEARKAWRQTERIRPPIEQLLMAVDRAKHDWRYTEPQFIPHPASWLRAERWADEADPEPQEPSYDERMAAQDRKRWR